MKDKYNQHYFVFNSLFACLQLLELCIGFALNKYFDHAIFEMIIFQEMKSQFGCTYTKLVRPAKHGFDPQLMLYQKSDKLSNNKLLITLLGT